MSDKRTPIEWNNVFVLAFGHALAIVAVFYLIFGGNLPQNWMWWLVGTCVFYGLPVTAGYHRYYSHKSFDAHTILQLYFLLIGAGTLEGPVASTEDPSKGESARGSWAPKHRDHHRYVDTPLDPYNIKQGAWWAHMGWIFRKASHSPLVPFGDLRKDPLLALQEKYYVLLAVFFGILLPVVVGALLGNALFGLLVLGFLRIVINWQSTFCVNSLAHLIGSRPYKDASTAGNSFITALVTLGEGNHADHHKFPRYYRNGVHWYSWDPTGWFIWTMQWVGLTKNLYRPPPEMIAAARKIA